MEKKGEGVGGKKVNSHHNKPTRPQENQHPPILGIRRQQEPDPWKRQLRNRAHNRAPHGKVIDTDERMRAPPDPADGGEGAHAADDAYERDPDGREPLPGRHVVVV